MLDAVHVARAVVVARDGLEALADTHDDHEEDESQAIGNAVSAYSEITAIGHQSIIHEDSNDTARELHGKRRDTDAHDVLDNVARRYQETQFQVQLIQFMK